MADSLDDDSQHVVACITAEYVDMLTIGETVLGGTTEYDAVGWASYGSVSAAL